MSSDNILNPVARQLFEYASREKNMLLEGDDGIIRFYGDFIEDIFAVSQDFENQYKRRTAVKSASAMFESTTFELWEQLKKHRDLSENVKIILSGKVISLADNGRIKEKKVNFPLKSRLRFALLQLVEGYDEQRKFQLTERIWEELDWFYALRNRLLHPESISIPQVGDESMLKLIELSQHMFTVLVTNITATIVSSATNSNQNNTNHPLYSYYVETESRFISSRNFLQSRGILR